MITAHGAQKGFRVVVGAGIILASLMVGDLTAMMRMVRAFQGSISAASDAIATPEGVRRQHDGEDPADILHDYLVTSRSITKLESYVTSSEFATWVQSRGFASVGEYLDTVYIDRKTKCKAVHEAMSSGNNDTSNVMLGILQGVGASLEARCGGRSGFTPLHCAARDGMVGTVRWLLDQGVDPNSRSVDNKRFPVVLAMNHGKLGQNMKANEIVATLVPVMDVSYFTKQDTTGLTILHAAIYYNNLTCVRYILGHPDVVADTALLKSMLTCNDGLACGFRFKNGIGKNPLQRACLRSNPGLWKRTFELTLKPLSTQAQADDSEEIILELKRAKNRVTLANTKYKPDWLIKSQLYDVSSWPPSSSSSSSSSRSLASSSNGFLTLNEEDDSY